MTTFPIDPIDAVTHPDPYPYYADLVTLRPLYHDTDLGMWVASSAAAVTAVLTSRLCRVRPPAEPVPAELRGSPAGTVFQHMVRFNDGPGHCPFKRAATAALDAISPDRAATTSATLARALADEIAPERDPGRLSRFAFRLPVAVAASLLGVPGDVLPDASSWAADFAHCLAPGSDPEEVAKGNVAAGRLLALMHDLASRLQDGPADTLLAILARQARLVGIEDMGVVVANAIGFLFQAHDATAGLIGNTVLALASRPDLHARLRADPALLPGVIDEVLRFDPPVQNTRRFVAADGEVAGQAMRAGDAILVLLAAAGRDLAANPHPERFVIDRVDRRHVAFGAGVHACPGTRFATTIAGAAVTEMLTRGADPARLAMPARYRPSQNIRIALT